MSLGINSLAPFFAKASLRQRRIGWNMSSMASVMVAYFFLGCPPRVAADIGPLSHAWGVVPFVRTPLLSAMDAGWSDGHGGC